MRGKFTADIDAFVKKAGKRLDAFLQTFTFDLYLDIVEGTPVDTGFLRSNWIPSLDSPTKANVGAAGGQPNLTYASVAISQAKFGQSVYLSNNASYAAHVEYGTSRMRGRAMVRTALARIPNTAQNALNKVKAMFP